MTSCGEGKPSAMPSWAMLKDPRIVRVSRAFGGKDRHSKVCTVRGLRDRRVRLSVQTAIQVYDLQDLLGLSQPSKVVDWLLNAAKHEIDELPPLQMPQGSSTYFRSLDHHHEAIGSGPNLNRDLEKLKEMAPGFNPFERWDPSSLTLSHPPRSFDFPSEHHQDLHEIGVMQWPSAHVYQHGGPWLPSPPFDSKPLNLQVGSQISNVSLASSVDSGARTVRPFNFNMTADLLHFHNKIEDERHTNGYCSS